MKVAVLYCGQPRNFSNEIYQNHYDHIFCKYDCDVYAHFWLDDNLVCGDTFATWFPKHELRIRSDIREVFVSSCKPKSVLFEPPLDTSVCGDMSVFTRTSAFGVVYNLHSMYTSLQKAYSLIPDISRYDFVIRLRTDLLVHNLCDLYDSHNASFIQCVTYHDQVNKGIDNAIWISPVSYAERMCSIIDNMYGLYASGAHMNDEQMMYSHIQKECLLDKVQFGKIAYSIQR